ncbi:MAG: hypothetical protein Q9160_002720 [Pyrenula sp. 1 TL-2023]
MSTPSTTTTTLPAHHSQYGYSHQNPYSANASAYPANNSVPTPRLTNSYHNFPAGNTLPYPRPQPSPQFSKQPSNPSIAPSQSASAMSDRGRKRQPDWDEFYRNGVPKEVIVIHDDTPPAEASRGRVAKGNGGTATQPAGKKRKIEQAYDTTYHDRPSYSVNPPQYGDSSNPSVSTDRTTSLHTTAPTSLGSYGSSNASNSYEDVNVGQKRKRAPQKETRLQTKRKLQETTDAFADYVPPPNPPVKAGEVTVPVVQDVRSRSILISERADFA